MARKKAGRKIRVKMPMGAFVEVVSLPIGQGGYDWHFMFIGRTGSIADEPQPGLYFVVFNEGSGGHFRPECLRLV